MPVNIVGRRKELDRIALIGDSPIESGLLLVGEHGSGKTRLLEAAQSESIVHSVLIRTNPAEAAWSLSGFSTLFSSINDSRAIEFSGRFSLRSTEPADVFAASRDLLSVVRGLALEPILLLIDDIDRMDPESQLLIGFMAGRMAGTGIRIVATARRIDPASPLAGFPYQTLEPLSGKEALELAKLVTGPSADDGTLQFIAAEGDGLPLAIVEIAQLLNDDQVRGRHALALPFRPSVAVKAFAKDRLDNIGEGELAMLERLSLAPLENIAALSSASHEDADAIDDLVSSELIAVQGQYIRLTNPLMRSYLYWRMDTSKRRQLHLEMAEASAGVDPKLEAWHASFARAEDESHATELLDAAIEFVTDGYTRAATEFAERALIIEPRTENLLPGVIRLVNGWLRQGELALASRYIFHANIAGASSELSVRLAILRVAVEYSRTWVVPDHDIEMSVGIHQTEDPKGVARLLDLAALCHAQRWETFQARGYLARSERLSDAVGASERGRSMHDITASLVDSLEGRKKANEPELQTDQASLAPLSSIELAALGQRLCYLERYGSARGVYARLITRNPVADPLWLEFGRFLAALNEIRSGNFHQATSAVDEWSQAMLPQLASRSSRLFFRAWYATASDQLDEAEELFAQCLQRTSLEGNAAINGWLNAFQGSLAQIDGDDEQALLYLDQVDVVSDRFPNPALLRHSADLVQAYMSVGRTAEAKRVYNGMVVKEREHPSRWLTLALARAEAAIAPDGLSVTLFQQAIDLFGPSDSPYELAKTLANFANRQAGFGLGQESQRTFAAARSAFEQAGAHAWARRLSGNEVRPTVDAMESLMAILTDDERQVAELVLQGYRNKEIAAALFISLRSVELRLTHIYRKVGARSRSHLVALLT